MAFALAKLDLFSGFLGVERAAQNVEIIENYFYIFPYKMYLFSNDSKQIC
jgi:hypothetical protein